MLEDLETDGSSKMPELDLTDLIHEMRRRRGRRLSVLVAIVVVVKSFIPYPILIISSLKPYFFYK
jgi:hypothetical protein